MRVLPVGDRSLLVEVAGVDEALALWQEARYRQVAAVDVVPAARTVLFVDVEDREALSNELSTWRPSSVARDRSASVEVPTVYDGPDLDAVARHWGMSTREVVATHTGTEMVVAFCGFAPGFAYCAGLPERLSVPRLDEPRTRVPVGSVGLAGSWTGIYPTASPGGWLLIGRTDLTLWDESRDHPAVLAPGTTVRFTEVP